MRSRRIFHPPVKHGILTPYQQRNLNNAFAYDLVPSPSVIIAALRAARRVNDFPTAVRIFEGTSLPPYNQLRERGTNNLQVSR